MVSETVAVAEERTIAGTGSQVWGLQWTPIVAGAFAASALSLILISFGAALGLGVASASPTWRDTSFALYALSGLYLIFQALISFGCGGYLAGRVRAPYSAPGEDLDTRDGLHGVASWALAVLIGAALASLVAFAASRPGSTAQPASSSEPSVLSFELDHLFRAPRRPPNLDMTAERAEAARILMTASSHNGVAPEDRTYLVQQVTALTALPAPDAERRVDTAIADAKTAIAKARAANIILAFSAAAALLFGAAAAWAGAVSGGRHRDGEPISGWMLHSNRWSQRRNVPLRPIP